MSIKKYIPNMTESVKTAVIVVILGITGIGAILIAKGKSILGR